MKSADGRYKRREFTTRGADPTVCVEWKNLETGDTLTEFQGVIVASGDFADPEGLFKDLEDEFQTDSRLACFDSYEDVREFRP